MKTDYNEILVDICYSNIIIYYYNNVTGCFCASETIQSIQLVQYTSWGSTYGYVESLRLVQSNY